MVSEGTLTSSRCEIREGGLTLTVVSVGQLNLMISRQHTTTLEYKNNGCF